MKTREKRLTELLSRDDVRGRIIHDLGMFDFYLNILLGMYFVPSPRTLNFISLISEKLSCFEKMAVLKELPYHKKYGSLEFITFVEKLRRLRNHLAHRHFVSENDRLLRDPVIRKWLIGYPAAYDAAYKRAMNQMRRLSNTKEFSSWYRREAIT